MTATINFIIRLVLTAIVVVWAILPYIDNSSNESVLGEIFKVGIIPSVLIIFSFFIMVAFYCRTLQRCLTLIKPENRKAKPKSVLNPFLKSHG